MIVIGTKSGAEIKVEPGGGIDVQVEGKVERFEVADVGRVMMTNALFGSATGYLAVGGEEHPVRVLRCVDPETQIEFHLYYPEESAARLAALVEGREIEVAKVVPARGNGNPPLQ